MSDKYDAAIEYLWKNPKEIRAAWGRPITHPGGCLFQYVGPEVCVEHDGITKASGCLTQIRRDRGYAAFNPAGEIDMELTEEIRNDERIPCIAVKVQLDDLPVFAEWQRRIDQRFRSASMSEKKQNVVT